MIVKDNCDRETQLSCSNWVKVNARQSKAGDCYANCQTSAYIINSNIYTPITRLCKLIFFYLDQSLDTRPRGKANYTSCTFYMKYDILVIMYLEKEKRSATLTMDNINSHTIRTQLAESNEQESPQLKTEKDQ